MRERARRLWDALRSPLSAVTIALGVIVAGVIAFEAINYSNAKARDERAIEAIGIGIDLQRLALAISDRNDCRSEIAGLIQAVRDERDNIAREREVLLALAQLAQARGDDPVTAQAIAEYDAIVDRQATAVDAVRSLPTVTAAANDGWTPSQATRETVPSLPEHVERCPTVEGHD